MAFFITPVSYHRWVGLSIGILKLFQKNPPKGDTP